MTSDHYFDRSEDGTHTADYKKHTPDILEAFDRFDATVFASEGREIPLKFRELIAVAVGITTQCVYCIDWHSRQAKKVGATDAEVGEAAWVATAIRAGGGFAHGRPAFSSLANTRTERAAASGLAREQLQLRGHVLEHQPRVDPGIYTHRMPVRPRFVPARVAHSRRRNRDIAAR